MPRVKKIWPQQGLHMDHKPIFLYQWHVKLEDDFSKKAKKYTYIFKQLPLTVNCMEQITREIKPAFPCLTLQDTSVSCPVFNTE